MSTPLPNTVLTAFISWDCISDINANRPIKPDHKTRHLEPQNSLRALNHLLVNEFWIYCQEKAEEKITQG